MNTISLKLFLPLIYYPPYSIKEIILSQLSKITILINQYITIYLKFYPQNHVYTNKLSNLLYFLINIHYT